MNMLFKDAEAHDEAEEEQVKKQEATPCFG